MHEKEHKRLKKSAEQGAKTPDNDMVISLKKCCLWTDEKVSLGERTRPGSLTTSATVSIAVQF